MDAGDVELESRWSAWLLERNRRGTRSILWIVVTLYPLFGVLDYLIAPREWLWLLYATRAVVTAVTMAMFRVSRLPVYGRHTDGISATYMVLISSGISMMTVFMGGLASPYYAGLTLTIVATGVLYIWPARVVIGTYTAIIASFLVPNIILGQHHAALTAVSNQFFLVSTAIIVGTGQVVAYRSQRDQVFKQLVIERTKKNLELAHGELKERDRFKSEFFANITHELKTPLTMILAPLELMVDGQLGNISDAQRSTLHSILRSGVKLQRLIGDLLDLSRLEESRLRLRVGEHDLVAYLKGLVEHAAPLAQRKAIALSFVCELPTCTLSCDIERMERVFINLLSNATKFTPANGHVTVRLVDEGEAVRVDVQDTGIGFPAEMAQRLFERFFQVDMARTRKFGGTGIGLALARELVELHGGSIWAEAREAGGATFSVRLQKGRAHFPVEVLDRRTASSAHGSGDRATDRGLGEWQLDVPEKFRLIEIDEATEQRVVERDVDEEQRSHSVLVVEDTPEVIRVIRLALHHHFRVLAAPDGLRGLELAIKHQPSVIVTDLMMPEIDGLELTRRLRADARTKHIPIVMLTARGEVEDRVAGVEGGVNAYLAKPFSARELVSTVHSLIEKQEATADILLHQKMDSLETLAGGLAHEIRNPLNYVGNAVWCIRRDVEKVLAVVGENGTRASGPEELAKLREGMERMFETAEAGVRRIGGTVDLMIRYSRDGYARAQQRYDAYAAARDVVATVLPTASHQVAVSFDLKGHGYIECVPEEFNQILTNLVQNAMEAVAPDGSGAIVVRGHRDFSDGLVLGVKDNGMGISPDEQAKIFTAFYTTKGAGRGMGMGLTIVRRVLAALGGTIAVTSAVGKGTEFVVRIPASAAKEQEAASPALQLPVS